VSLREVNRTTVSERWASRLSRLHRSCEKAIRGESSETSLFKPMNVRDHLFIDLGGRSLRRPKGEGAKGGVDAQIKRIRAERTKVQGCRGERNREEKVTFGGGRGAFHRLPTGATALRSREREL